MAFDKKVSSQHYAALCANIISISFGAFFGWPSASFLELQAPNSPLNTGPMSNVEAGYVGSMLCVGCILGTLFFAWFSEKIGRKCSLLLTAIPSLLGWGIIVIAGTPFELCISRFIGGFSGGGVFSVLPLYITEISETRVRGVLGSLMMLTSNLGVLLAYILGNFYSYSTVAIIMSLLTILFFAAFSFMPETPQYLIRQNKMEEAEKAMRYYRNVREIISKSSDELRYELEKMQDDENLCNTEENSITWSDINNRVARKSFMIGVVLMALIQLSGCFVLISYTAPIFQQTGSNLSPNVEAIIVGIIQLLGSYVTILLVERFGRKILLVSSAIGSCIGLTWLGGYIYFSALGYDTTSFNWMPVTSFSFITFIFSVGVLTLPFTVVIEIMPLKIRNVGNIFCLSLFWSLGFVILLYFPILSDALGMHSMMFIFAANCFLGAVFIIKFLPETKGKSIESILLML